MASISWVKLNIGIFENVKIKNLDTLPKGDTYFRIWINLLVLAGKTNNQGLVYFSSEKPYTNKTLAAVLIKPVKIVTEAITLFQELNMIEIQDGYIKILNWEEYQNLAKLDVLRENGREAKRRQREKQAALVEEMSSKCQISHDTALALALDKEKDKEKKKDKTKKLADNSRARSSDEGQKLEDLQGELSEIDSELIGKLSLS
jgi:predicted phage replisome organizer